MTRRKSNGIGDRHTPTTKANGIPVSRCPCYAIQPTVAQPQGTPCQLPPYGGSKLCSYHLELFEAIDREACLGITGDMTD